MASLYAMFQIRVGITDVVLKFRDETISLYDTEVPLDYYLFGCKIVAPFG